MLLIMKTLQLSEEQAIKIYETATPETKIILESTFGKSFFEPELITSYEDACKFLNLDPDYCKLSPKCKAFHKLEIICKAMNKGKKADVSVYAPFFNYDEKTGCFYKDGINTVRIFKKCNLSIGLYYYAYEDAEYAGNKFIDLYKDLLL